MITPQTADDIAAPSDLGRIQAMHQISTFLGVNGGSPPSDLAEFWYQVAVFLEVGIPADDVPAMVKQVFAKLDEEWDEDYLTENGDEPSLEAYETLHEALKALPPKQIGVDATEIEADESDEEDDSIGSVEESFDLRASTTQTDIDTTLNKIGKGTIILNPDWQRNFVWKLKKQRRLVESILLGLPIPSLLLFRESASGKTYVIDGRQRLESISRFRSGKPEKGEVRKRFKTFPPTTEGWRPGEKLHSAAGRYYDDLPQEFKAKFDAATLVLHTFVDLPPEKLYQIFRRYNTGAEQLRAAEIRNAVYQASPVHQMMYRLGGEHGDESVFRSEDERQAARTLQSIMKGKTARYGAYDFVGRYFAFAYMTSGSVANATNDFLSKHTKNGADPDKLAAEFVSVLNTTIDWYEFPLVTPSDDGKFHAFLATVQLVATKRLLEHVDAGRVSADDVRRAIADHWESFATEVLGQKQNSTAFWTRQRDWIEVLEKQSLANAAI